MLREYARLGMVVTTDGRRLWATLERAQQYAEARVFMFKRRQRVAAVRLEGRLLWHVACARPGHRDLEAVAEPCS